MTVTTRARGPKPRFTAAQIVEHALVLLRRDGREALTLRLLADDLGVSPMALYRYFADKDELLDAVLAAALAPAAEPGDTDAPWDVQLEQAIRDMYAALHADRAIAELMALRRSGGHLDPLRERLFAITAGGGLDEQEGADLLRALTSYVLGFSLVETAAGATPRHAVSSSSFDYGLQLILGAIR